MSSAREGTPSLAYRVGLDGMRSFHSFFHASPNMMVLSEQKPKSGGKRQNLLRMFSYKTMSYNVFLK
jgi:hypothetical protein